MLATDRGDHCPRLATVFRLWPLGVFGLWVVLGIQLFLGLGSVPLWTMVPAWSPGLVLAARTHLGTFMGQLEV